MTDLATGATRNDEDVTRPDTELVARATALIPLIREYAAQGSEARRVAPEVAKALEEAEIFHLMVPKRYGGHGASLRTAVEAVARGARGAGPTARGGGPVDGGGALA